MKFGARMFKTGLAVVLAFSLTQWFGLTPGIYAAVAAILTVQPSIYRSFQHFLEQIQANLIGALIGISFVTLFGTNPIFVGIAIIIVIGINLQLRFDKAIGLSIVTVMIIMESTADNYFIFAFNRLSLIMIGIISSLIINALFMPPKYEHRLLEKIKLNHEQFSLLLRFSLHGELMGKTYRDEKKKAKDLLQESMELFRLHKEEKHYVRRKRFTIARKMRLFKQMIECNQQIRNTLQVLEKLHPYIEQLPPAFRKELDAYNEQLINYHEKVLLRYSGMIRLTTEGPKTEEVINQQHLINLTERELLALPLEVQAPVLSIVGQMLQYATQLHLLDKLIHRDLKHHQQSNHGTKKFKIIKSNNNT